MAAVSSRVQACSHAPRNRPPAAPTAPPPGRASPPGSAAVSPSATLAVDAKAKALRGRRGRRHRVRRRGARLPHAPTTSSRRPSPPATTPSTTTTRRPPASPRCARPSRPRPARDSGLRRRRLARCSSPTGPSKPSTRPSPRCSTPATRSSCPAPYWTTYPEVIALAGGVPVAVPTDESTGFHLTVDALEAALTPATKVLLFVSPNNPTGAVCTPEEVAAIGRWAADRGPVGRHRRDLRAPRLRRAHLRAPCRWPCPSSPTGAS